MKCWYLIDTICDRPHGICERCERYEDWRKESERVTELKLCPFCGQKLHRYEEYGEWIIECLTRKCLMICGPLCKKDIMERMLEVKECQN